MTGRPEEDGLAEIKRLLRSLDETSAGDAVQPPDRARVEDKAVPAPAPARASAESTGNDALVPPPAPLSSPLTIGRAPPPPPVVRTTGKPRSGPVPLAIGLVAAAAAVGGLGVWWVSPGLLTLQSLSARTDASPSRSPSRETLPATSVATAPVSQAEPDRAARPESGPAAAEVGPAAAPPSRVAQAVRSQSAVTEPSRALPPPVEAKIRAPARLSGTAGQSIALPIEIDGSVALPTAVVVVAGLPAGTRLSKGAPRPTGDWSLSAADAAGLSMTLPQSPGGRHQLTIELRSVDAAVMASVRSTLDVVAAPAKAPMSDAVRPPETTAMEWLAEAKRLMNAGHIASSRLVLERAADAGLGEAARLLGDSYDPAKLYALGVRGMSGDVQKAIHWYERADELGDPQAKARLLALGAR